MTPQFRNARMARSRLVVEGRLVLRAPARFGGVYSDTPTDAPLLRGADGLPYLPGSSLKGLLRSLARSASDDVLFGDAWGTAATGAPGGRQARLVIDDARVVTSDGVVPTEMRDGVAIEPALGIAADRKKYDGEWLPAGTAFELRLELLLAGDSLDDRRCDGLLELLSMLEQGRMRVGARTSRGFGATEIVIQPAAPTGTTSRWNVTQFDCRSADGLFAWLGEGVEGLASEWPQPTSVQFADATRLAADLSRPAPAPVVELDFVVALDLAVDGSLLIRGPGDAPGGATKESDAAHLGRRTFAGREEPVVAGTSLAGVLRHRCLRIARTRLPPRRVSEADALIAEMFGAVVERRTGARGGTRASRVRVPELVVQGGRRLRHTRVRIDPWTGGAAESLLFTEDALFGGRVQGELRVRPRLPGADADLEPVERALLLLALRDLATGDLWVGGEAAAGRGRFKPGGQKASFAVVKNGSATMTLRYESGEPTVDPPGAERDYMEALDAWANRA